MKPWIYEKDTNIFTQKVFTSEMEWKLCRGKLAIYINFGNKECVASTKQSEPYQNTQNPLSTEYKMYSSHRDVQRNPKVFWAKHFVFMTALVL